MYALAKTCRCTMGALVFERDHCMRCGRDLHNEAVRLGSVDGLLLLDAAIERKRIEMREAGRFDGLYVADGLDAVIEDLADEVVPQHDGAMV